MYASKIGARSNDLQYLQRERSFHVGSPAERTALNEISDPGIRRSLHRSLHTFATDAETDDVTRFLWFTRSLLQGLQYLVLEAEWPFQYPLECFHGDRVYALL